NETNAQLTCDQHTTSLFAKDGINDHVVNGAETVNPAQFGTKGAAWYRFDVPAGESVQVRLRLTNGHPEGEGVGADFDEVVAAREAEADEFYEDLAPDLPLGSPL